MRLVDCAAPSARSLLDFPVFSNASGSVSLEMLASVSVSLYPLCSAEENESGFLFSFLFCLPFDRISNRSDTPKLSPSYPQSIVNLNQLEY